MALLPYVDEANAPQSIKEMLERTPIKLNVFRMICNSEAAARPFSQLGNSLLTKAKLDAKLREIAILRVAEISKSVYEWTQHVPIAKAVGVTDEQVATIGAWQGAHCFNHVEQLVLRFTDEVAHDAKASAMTLAALNKHLGATEVVELILSIGFWRMVAGLLNTTEVDLEEFAGKINLLRPPQSK